MFVLGGLHKRHLKSTLYQTIFKNLGHTAEKTQHFIITKISWLMVFTVRIIQNTQIHCEHNADLWVVEAANYH
jgi:hypothetical protein